MSRLRTLEKGDIGLFKYFIMSKAFVKLNEKVRKYLVYDSKFEYYVNLIK